MRQVSDPALRKQMSTCYESLNSCSLESFPEAVGAEIELENAVNILCANVELGNMEQLGQLIQNVQVAMKHRNQAIRMARYS